MILQEYRQTFYDYSGKVSDLNRQLAFGAIAIIWLFKRDYAGQPTIPHALLLPGFFAALGLSFDMLHYLVASVIWRFFYRRKEKEHIDEDVDIKHGVLLELPIWLLFGLKLLFTMICYGFIAHFLVNALLSTSSYQNTLLDYS
jgi:hypothetical protein